MTVLRTPVDLVCIATSAPGPDTFQLGNAVQAFQGVEALDDGKSYSYSVQQDSNFEFGYGTFNASARTLTRTVLRSSYGGAPVSFNLGAQVTFTFLAEDLLARLAAIAGPSPNLYGLQWSPWFNPAPVADELLALYVAPLNFNYLQNFAGAATAPPLVLPTADWAAALRRQVGGLGAWSDIGTVDVTPDGTVSLSTAGGGPVAIAGRDRLGLFAPTVVDATFKGYLPS
jgi:hypothetical protein